jgi:hypothetical protein
MIIIIIMVKIESTKELLAQLQEYPIVAVFVVA